MDDQTWLDLEMDRVFARVDRTLSGPGRLTLYGLLRRPLLDDAPLADRDRVIDAIARDDALRRSLRDDLARLGRAARSEAGLVDLLWAHDDNRGATEPWLVVFGLLGVTSLVAAATLGGGWIVAAVAVFGANAHWHVRTRVRHQEAVSAITELSALFRCARALSRTTHPALADRVARLRRTLASTKSVARSAALVSAGRLQDLLYEYVSVLLLLEARAIVRAERQCREQAGELQAMFAVAGEIDALHSVASFRHGLDTWTRPLLSSSEGRPRLEIDEAIHPLVEGARPNSVALVGRGCVVTGPNMAGKSTFLRTLGVNALLAQTLFTSTAARYSGSFLLVRSSMCVADSLAAGKSLYLAEAERLLILVHTVDGAQPVLCLVDELLAGTNASDRARASAAVLAYLARGNALVVASTHDADLAESLGGELDGRHFDGDGVGAAFRLQPGVTRERNAVQLLARLGFPAGVLEGLEGAGAPPGNEIGARGKNGP